MSQGLEMSDGEYHAREFMRRLREESVNKSDPLPEWTKPILISLDFEDTAGGRCICKKKIYQIYQITNKITNKNLDIGCDCAARWFQAKFSCTNCHSPLGNVRKRMKEQNFICPKCAREQIARQKAEQKERETLEVKYFNKCFHHPTEQHWQYYNYPKHHIRHLIDIPYWCNFVLNVDTSNMSPSHQVYIGNIQKLIRLTWDVQTS